MEKKRIRRVYGLEVEFGLVFLGARKKAEEEAWGNDSPAFPMMPPEVEKFFFQELNRLAGIRFIRHTMDPTKEGDAVFRDFFTRNGGRIYLDAGQHPETATPECATLREVVLYDKAAERIMEEALRETNRHLAAKDGPEKTGRDPGGGRQLLLFKNNTHTGDTTYGCHENYLVLARTHYHREIMPCLTPFLVTRQIFCGAGKIWGDRFEISQRGRFIRCLESPFTRDGSSRSIFNSRGEGSDEDDEEEILADHRYWRRLHLILGDSNMSEYTAWLKLGTTALVLRMVEDGFLKFDIAIPEAVKVYRLISRDTACRRKFRVIRKASGGTAGSTVRLTAVEIQELYLREAGKYLRRRGKELPPESLKEFRKVVREWKKVLAALKTDPMSLKEEIDWVIKKNLLEKYRRRYGISWRSRKIRVLDAQYHDIDRNKGLYYFLEKEGMVRRLLADKEIDQAKIGAPDDTRANWRAALINFAETRGFAYMAGWNDFSLYALREKGLIWDREIVRIDPLRSKPPDFKKLLKRKRRKY